MNEFLIPALAFISVMSLGGAAVITRAGRQAVLRARLDGAEELAEIPSDGEEEKAQGFLGAVAERLSGIGTMISTGKPSESLRLALTQAGYHHSGSAAIYLGTKAVLLLAGFAGMLIVAPLMEYSIPAKILIVACVSGGFFFLPNYYVYLKGRSRAEEVRCNLPDVIDLLEVCVSAGMGLDMAWNSAADEFKGVSPLLAEEMELTNLEMHLGADRSVAMRHMAKRTGSDDLDSLVSVLVQSERFGTSVGDALEVFAQSMRELRRQRAEEMAEKMAVKMIFPLVCFILPVVIIVAVGPASITIIDVLGGS